MPEIDPQLMERSIAAEKARTRRGVLFGFVLVSFLMMPAGYVIARLGGYEGWQRLAVALGLCVLLVAIGLLVIKIMQWIASDVVMGFLQPGGSARGVSNTSRAEALAAAGAFHEAAAEFEAARAISGDSIPSMRVEAEMHATASGDPKRAEVLLLRIRRSAEATRNDELYASHRLIDLYTGPLDDQGRAMVELRRMADRFPDTIDGQGALMELNRRKTEGA